MSAAKATKMALDEGRTWMLGAQILFGFQLQAPFQDAFGDLGAFERNLCGAVLAIMALVIGFLIAPSARHRIVERGEASPTIVRFISRMGFAALVPFMMALGSDVYVATSKVAGRETSLLCGLAAGAAAALFWFGPVFLAAPRRKESGTMLPAPTSTEEKIDFALTEARVILPGVQALLGFQLTIALTHGFSTLPEPARWCHFAALASIAVAMILLMTPATYHRLVYDGDSHPAFLPVATSLILAATVCLALGLCIDIGVVVHKVTNSVAAATAMAAGTIVPLVLLWHLWPWWARRRRSAAGKA